jgi:outer membrane protein assembly factor BamB
MIRQAMNISSNQSPSSVSIRNLSKIVSALLLSSLLSACSGFSGVQMNPLTWFADEEVNPPKQLVNIDQEVQLRRQWNVNIGNGQGGNYTQITPVIDSGIVYAASENGNVASVNAESGDVRWRTDLEVAITGGVGAGEGLVMVGTQDAEVVALDQLSGEILWRQPVSSEVLSAPQTDGEVVVAQTVDGKLLALSVEDGSQLWIYETSLPALTLRGTSEPVFTATGSVIAGFSNGTLVSVTSDTGVWQWEERVAVPEGQYDIDRVIDVDGKLLLDGNRILASSYQGNLMAFDITTGRIVWGMEASSYHGLERGFGNLYYCDDRSVITAVRDNSEDIVWSNEDLENREITAPTSIGNYVAVADFEGYVHLISQVDGRIVGRTEVDGDGVRSNLLADNGRLIVFGNSGRLAAYDLQ